MKVHKIFGPTIQGEGYLVGMKSVFVRLAECNIACKFCDTDYSHKYNMTPEGIVREIAILSDNSALVVITGGEPLMQHAELRQLLDMLTIEGYNTQIETNGMYSLEECKPTYISCSPKVPVNHIKLERMDSLKILYPYLVNGKVEPISFQAKFPTANWKCIQPIESQNKNDGYDTKANIAGAISEVKRIGYGWRLGLQLHKYIGEE